MVITILTFSTVTATTVVTKAPWREPCLVPHGVSLGILGCGGGGGAMCLVSSAALHHRLDFPALPWRAFLARFLGVVLGGWCSWGSWSDVGGDLGWILARSGGISGGFGGILEGVC